MALKCLLNLTALFDMRWNLFNILNNSREEPKKVRLLGLVFGMELIKMSKLHSCKIQLQKEIRK